MALMGRTAVHTGKMVTWEETMKSNFQYVSRHRPHDVRHAGPDAGRARRDLRLPAAGVHQGGVIAAAARSRLGGTP